MTATLYPSALEIEDILLGPGSITCQRAGDTRLSVTIVDALPRQRAHPLLERFQGWREDGRRCPAFKSDAAEGPLGAGC